jgi:4'-phosphopantetheinyl transferase
VDVEFIRPLSNMESITRRYFSKAETKKILDLPPSERHSEFFKCWTIKEAYLKATGKGLSGLQEIQIPWDEKKPHVNDIVVTDASSKIWSLYPLYPTPDYVAAFAVEGNGAVALVIRQFS